jgi:Glycosyltransferase 61
MSVFKSIIYSIPLMRTTVSFFRSVSWKLRRFFNRKYNKKFRGVEIGIDNSTSLKEVSLAEIVNCEEPSQTIVVPEIYVDAKQHRLSVLPEKSPEREIYVSRNFRAPEMTLECLFDQYWFPQYGFLVSKSGKVWKHSILGQYADPHFLATYAVEEREAENGANAYIFYDHILRGVPIIEEPSLITSHYASYNYGHYMLDMVPLLQLGMKIGLNMISRPLLEWHKPIYERIGVKPENMKIISERVVFLKKVFMSIRHNAVSTYAASPHHRDVFAEILQSIPQSKDMSRPRKRIFLSRGESRNRNLRNRTELEKMLNQEGFETVRPELLAFDKQALLFSDADIIVSEFGAIMANVVFCRKGTKVVEIIPDMQNDPWSRHLCASLDLEHITLCHKIRDEDREAYEIAGRTHKNIFFSFEANIELIRNIVRQL